VLADLPAVMILVGLAAYAVLGGADYGAGAWTILSGTDTRGRRLRDHARHAMGPVWEANHVWLIFVLVICWTAYPKAFGSITSTLAIPLFLIAVGIILRGTAYAVRGSVDPERAVGLERLFGLSSVLTPFALGAVAGAIASGRVPVGNAAGDRWSSWLNPTSIVLGVLFVATSAYLAAVYLAADARRLREPELERAFRVRAVGGGVVAGALALAGLAVVRSDAERIWDGLTRGGGIAALAVSAVAGLATIGLVLRGRFEWARAAGTAAVVAVIVGWAVAQRPQLLPGLTIRQAAAPHASLLALTIGAGVGSLILVPALVLLFRLYLRGAFDPSADGAPAVQAPPTPDTRTWRLAGPIALLVAGTVLSVGLDPVWARVLGAGLLLAFAVSLFRPVAALGAGERPAPAKGRAPDRPMPERR
jgi:cytochrome d ubiquinol oxidase subunit II